MSFIESGEDVDPLRARMERQRRRREKSESADEEYEPDEEKIAGTPFKDLTMAALDFTSELVERRREAEGADPRLSPRAVNLCRAMISAIPNSFIAKQFIMRSHKLWGAIRTRDKDRFGESITSLFSGIPEKKVNAVSSYLLETDAITGEYLTDLSFYWDALEKLVHLSTRYIHEGRKPTGIKDGVWQYSRPKFFKKVDIAAVAREWDIDLTQSIVEASAAWRV